MYRSHTCGELRSEHIGTKVTLAGWMQRSRDLGGMTFIDLRDRYGLTQLVFNMEVNAELCEQARKLGREFVIQVEGEVIERSSKNKNMPTGDIEINVLSLIILNAAKLPPFTIEDDTDGGDELRMQYRYLDLRRNPVLEKLMDVKVRQFDWTEGDLHQDAGFIAQELAPVLSGIVTEGKTEEDMWQMDYSRLTPYLVKAIQELTARVAELEAK